MECNQYFIGILLGSVQVLRHRVRGEVGGPASIADADDALRGGWGVQNQNDDVILGYVSDKYVFM